MPAENYARAEVVTLSPGCTVSQALDEMRDQDVGCIVITEKGKPVGIATDRDLALEIHAEGVDPERTELGQAMEAPLACAPRGSSLRECTGTMARLGLRRLPLVDGDGQLTGLLCADDLLPILACELFHLRSPIVAQAAHLRGGYSSRPARTIEEHYRRAVETVGLLASPGEIARKMREASVGCVVVVDEDGEAVGMITDRDLALRVPPGDDASSPPLAADLMSQPLFTADSHARLEEIIQVMEMRSIRRIPVVDAKTLVGIVTLDDLIALLGQELWELGKSLRHAAERPPHTALLSDPGGPR